jgi:hypothetical protein
MGGRPAYPPETPPYNIGVLVRDGGSHRPSTPSSSLTSDCLDFVDQTVPGFAGKIGDEYDTQGAGEATAATRDPSGHDMLRPITVVGEGVGAHRVLTAPAA